MLQEHKNYMMYQMVDSKLASTRVFWRKKFFDMTDEEANDPRPFIQVLEEKETN